MSAKGTGYPVETLAMSVYNIVSFSQRDMTERDAHSLLCLPQIWDTRCTLDEVQRGTNFLLKKQWVMSEVGEDGTRKIVIPQRHPETKRGLDVVRDPRDGFSLIRLGAYPH